MVKIGQFDQHFRGQFPTPPSREFFGALQGIKSGDQGNFRPDQRIPGIGDSCRDSWRRPVSDQVIQIARQPPIVPADFKRPGERKSAILSARS